MLFQVTWSGMMKYEISLYFAQNDYSNTKFSLIANRGELLFGNQKLMNFSVVIWPDIDVSSE